MNKKVSKVLYIILLVILVPILLINLVIMVKSLVSKDEVPSIFGYKPMIVLTGSMEPTIKRGDLVLSKEVNATSLKVDDIISYRDNENAIITHRIVTITNGEGFVDRSINNAFDTTVRVKCVGVSDDRDVTLTVYKKNNNIFSNFNYDIVDMNNVINNTYNFPKYSTMPYTYLIRHAAYDNNLDTDHSDTLTGYIRTTLEKGTYKAVYDVRYGNKISTDFYTFYVK